MQKPTRMQQIKLLKEQRGLTEWLLKLLGPGRKDVRRQLRKEIESINKAIRQVK